MQNTTTVLFNNDQTVVKLPVDSVDWGLPKGTKYSNGEGTQK
jgi:hypothetical protein